MGAQWVAIVVSFVVGAGAFLNSFRAARIARQALKYQSSFTWVISQVPDEPDVVTYRVAGVGELAVTDVVIEFAVDPHNLHGGVVTRNTVKAGDPIDCRLRIPRDDLAGKAIVDLAGGQSILAVKISWIDPVGKHVAKWLEAPYPE